MLHHPIPLQPLPKGVGEALLRERSPSGQAAREAALNGAVVLFVCAGYGKVRTGARRRAGRAAPPPHATPAHAAPLPAVPATTPAARPLLSPLHPPLPSPPPSPPPPPRKQKRFIYEKARSLGVKAILVDSPNHWGRDCVGDAFDAFYPVDLSRDADTVLADIATIYDGVVKVRGCFRVCRRLRPCPLPAACAGPCWLLKQPLLAAQAAIPPPLHAAPPGCRNSARCTASAASPTLRSRWWRACARSWATPQTAWRRWRAPATRT